MEPSAENINVVPIRSSSMNTPFLVLVDVQVSTAGCMMSGKAPPARVAGIQRAVGGMGGPGQVRGLLSPSWEDHKMIFKNSRLTGLHWPAQNDFLPKLSGSTNIRGTTLKVSLSVFGYYRSSIKHKGAIKACSLTLGNGRICNWSTSTRFHSVRQGRTAWFDGAGPKSGPAIQLLSL